MDIKLLKVVDDFPKKKIAIIGDLMLDRYVEGNVSRISPEAPIQILKIENERFVPGGAGNTANNITALKAKAYLLGVIGNDNCGRTLISELKKIGVNTEFILKDESRPTIEKTRFIGVKQQLLRVDNEKIHDIDDIIGKKIVDNLQKIINEIDIIIVSDYGKGVVTNRLMDAIKKIAKDYKKKIVADIKPQHKDFFKDVDVITPNFKESSEIAGMEGENEDIFVHKLGKKIVKELNTSLVITRGPKGMTLFEKNNIEHIPTEARDVFDVSGAGDTVVAVITLGLASGLSLKDSAILANHAAGIEVSKLGTATISPEELKGALRMEISDSLKESIKVKQDVVEKQLHVVEDIVQAIIDTYKNKKKILIFGNGGSASDAQHLAGELVGRFKIEREGLPAIALTTDTSILTSIANDYGFNKVFERQIEALGNKGDVAVAFTTSGKSENINIALEKAKKMGLKTIVMTGKDGGEAVNIADLSIVVPSDNTPRIQETHIALIHIICELLEKQLYGLKEVK